MQIVHALTLNGEEERENNQKTHRWIEIFSLWSAEIEVEVCECEERNSSKR